jgi:hypothetical protein
MDELKLLKEAAPYLLPFFGVLLLIVFVKNSLFTGMMSTETYKEQMERERLVLLHYTNITSQLDDMIRLAKQGELDTAMITHKLEDLATAIDDNIVNQILRLSPEERNIIKAIRNREPITEMLRKHDVTG